MTEYFHQHAALRGARRTYQVTDDLIEVMAADQVPERLRPLARELGIGSALSSPPLLQRDLVNLHEEPEVRHQVAGPATAVLLGGSVSAEGELEATGVTFGVSGGVVGFVTFAIPAALLVPGGGFYVAYRLYRLLRDTAALRRYARVSQAAPHVAIAVAACDHEVTRDEARLLRDLLRGRVGSRAERYGLLKLELDPEAKQQAAFDALRNMAPDADDWPSLLSIAIATAHADDVFSDEEREMVGQLRELTTYSPAEFERLARAAEEQYLLRCHLGAAMVRACHRLARAGEEEVPDDATLLLDIVLRAAVPGDLARVALARDLREGTTGLMSADELTRGASTEKPSLFQRAAGAKSESDERVWEFGRTMALFVATLEQWRGWVVRACRAELFAVGALYGLGEKQLRKWLDQAHRNIEELRHDWVAPRPWEAPDDYDVDVMVRHHGPDEQIFGVTGLSGGRFLFHRAETSWVWKSAETQFDAFCRRVLSVEVQDLVVRTDDTTFELLTITIDAHDSELDVRRG